MATSNATAHKRTLRARCRAYRASLSLQEHRRLSRRICARLARLAELEAARVVHIFWPMVGRREVDVRPIIMYLCALGKEVVLPVMAGPPGAPELLSVPFTYEAALVPGRWGVMEPRTGTPVPRSAIDLIIAPALAVTRQGTRVGYGGGYYDALLTGMRTDTVCPVFDTCLFDDLTPEPHDVPVQRIVTETRTITCS